MQQDIFADESACRKAVLLATWPDYANLETDSQNFTGYRNVIDVYLGKKLPKDTEKYPLQKLLGALGNFNDYKNLKVIYHDSKVLVFEGVLKGKKVTLKMSALVALLPHLERADPLVRRRILSRLKDQNQMLREKSVLEETSANLLESKFGAAFSNFFVKPLDVTTYKPSGADAVVIQQEHGGTSIAKEFLELAELTKTEDVDFKNQLIDLVHQGFQKLHQVNKQGVLLLDIKPDNIVYSEKDGIRFIDLEGAEFLSPVSQSYDLLGIVGEEKHLYVTRGFNHPNIDKLLKSSVEGLSLGEIHVLQEKNYAQRYDQYAMAESMRLLLYNSYKDPDDMPYNIKQLLDDITAFKELTKEESYNPEEGIVEFKRIILSHKT